MRIESRLARLEQKQPPPGDAGSVVGFKRPAHIAEFATSPDFLGLPLYPTQLLILKLVAVEIDLLTPEDLETLRRWMSGYTLVDDLYGIRFDGTFGTTPDLMERLEWCRSQGRRTFAEVVLIVGRRAGKSLLSAVLALWTLWGLIEMGDPHAALRIPRGKRIGLLVFGTSRENAVRDLFGDVQNLLLAAPCFEPFVEHSSSSMIRLRTPAQLAAPTGRRQHGHLVVTASPTVATAPRGMPITFLTLDEAAYLDTGTTTVGTDLYAAALPATLQFKDSLVILPSTPASKAGVFFEQARQATLVDQITGRSLFMDRLLVHLPSTAAYEGWKEAHSHAMWPGGPGYPVFEQAIIEDDDDRFRSLQLANPESFRTEIQAQWQANQASFFSEDTVSRAFAPFKDRVLIHRTHGEGHVYLAHADPSISDANFALAIGHSEQIDADTHVFVDRIVVWRPRDFPDGHIDYTIIEEELVSIIDGFRLQSLSFDAFNSSFLVDRLRPRARQLGLGTNVHVVTANHAEKWDRYQLLKTLANQGLLHIPHHELAMEEMRFVQARGTTIGHPTSGHVTTDDTTDAIAWLADRLVGTNSSVFAALSNFRSTTAVGDNPFAAFYTERRAAQRARGAFVNPASHPRWHQD